ncbi:hypothetical protein [Ruegeria sp. EL01]|uniref:hypothetical protein n=1 Tax=Ruegeria sp. EL01 TaxID=2107578 RepID=UPI001C1FE77C|nr:hypothetical protein [Ruegeria sp. EL01]
MAMPKANACLSPRQSKLNGASNLKTKIITLALSLLVTPTAGIAETFKESFECHFGRGLANRPTPSHLVFSVDEFGRSALIHEVDIPDINTHSGPGRVKRDSIRRLSIGWVGENYVYSASGRSIASNESVIDAIDLKTQEFSVFLDRKTMKATARSSSPSAYLPRDGYATGKCVAVATPK